MLEDTFCISDTRYEMAASQKEKDRGEARSHRLLAEETTNKLSQVEVAGSLVMIGGNGHEQ